MTAHRPSLSRFHRFLERRQREAEDSFDPVEFRDRLGSRPLGVGYTSDTLLSKYGANLNQLLPRAVPMNDRRFVDCDAFLGVGVVADSVARSHPGMERIFSRGPEAKPIALFEQGFVASVASWAQSFATGRRDFACLSYVLDDIAHYYMSEYPNRLIRKLNGAAELSDEERARARRNMDRLRAEKISKYNAQPIVELPPIDRPRVLVCDQTYADASTVYGLADDAAFERMLADAILENPEAEILVKTHPDTLETANKEKEKKRLGFYTGLRDHDNVRVVTAPMNPIALMEQVDRVYVGTSGMGMEALILGKDVVCYGAPFFAGWGLTDDRRPVPHRERTRTVEEVFHYFYIWYTHYVTPDSSGPAEIEDAMDYIVANRGRETPREPTTRLSESPRVSVVIPMHNVEAYIEPCLRSVLDQTLRDVEVLVVNDQSPDGSQAIVDRIAAEDPRLKSILMPENVGQGFARNAGIDAASGQYVWFIDSDDLVGEPDALERLVRFADIDAADMVRARKHIRDERGRRTKMRVDPVERFFRPAAHGLDLESSPVLLQNNHFWNFLYRRDFLNEHEIRFELTQWEERPFLIQALLAAESVTTTDVVGTIYRVRAGSTARRKKNALDIERRQQNIRSCLRQFRDRGAHAADSPLHGQYIYCASRSLTLIFSGFQLAFLLDKPSLAERIPLYEEIRTILDEMTIDPEELSDEPAQVDAALFHKGHYHLVFASCLSGEFELLDRILRGERLTQADAYALLVEHKSDAVGRALQRYIREEPPVIVHGRTPRGVVSGPSKPKLVLHIGSTKTGSTYLQHFLDLNRGALLERGILYPEFGIFSQPGRPHKTAGHADFIHDARSVGGSPLLTRLLAAVQAAPCEVYTVVISSEAYFLSKDPGVLAEYFKPHFDVSVLVYLRRPDDWANSQYSEFVGGGAMGRIVQTPQEWVASPKTRRRLDYAGMLDAWAAALGDEKMIVRPYEKSQWEGNDLLTDFCKSAGIPGDLDAALPRRDHSNSMPLSASHIRLMRRLNALPFPDVEHYFAFVEEVWRIVREAGEPAGNKDSLGPELRARIMENAVDGHQSIARRYLGRDDGVLFEDLAPRESEPAADERIPLAEVEAILDAYARIGNPEIHAGTKPRAIGVANTAVGRKFRKLRRDPQSFLQDSKNPALKWVGKWWPR